MNGKLRPAAAALWLAACVLLGGSTAGGALANLVLQLAALGLIAWATLAPDVGERPAGTLLIGLLWLGLAALLLSLVPMPPALWTNLPGRAAVENGFQLLGEPLPWLPLSLAPEATLASGLWLLPPVAMLLLMLRLRAFKERWIGWAIVIVTGLSVALGALQRAGGEGSPFYFYKISSFGLAVGPFANANHMSILLVSTIPFLAALYLSSRKGSRRSLQETTAQSVILVVALLVVVVGLLLNNSLAALGLTPLVAAASVLMVFDRPKVRRFAPVGIAGLAIGAVALFLAVPFGNDLTGADASGQQLSRATFFKNTLEAGWNAFPFGTGIGTFQRIYLTLEDPSAVTGTFVNHAHNDYLELFLEGGLVAVALIALFISWWLRRVLALWRATDTSPFALAASIATGAILLHSFVDYPLRTAGVATLFVLCCCLMTGITAAERMRRGRAKQLTA